MNEGHAAIGPGRRPAVVLAAHGAECSESAGSSLRRLRKILSRRAELGTVDIAFVHTTPTLTDVLERLSASPDLCIIPMFAAEGHHTRRVIPAAVDSARAARPGCVIRQATALGADPAYTHSLARRVRALVRHAGIETSNAVFLAIGHGARGATMAPDDAANRLARALRADFDISEALYLDGAPLASSWRTKVGGADTVIAPVFFSDGRHASIDVPQIFDRPTSAPEPADAIDGPWSHEHGRLWFVALPPATACVADIIVARACGHHVMTPVPWTRDEMVVRSTA